MNWTGGRLRRQSHNRPGSLSRIQKQHFAKARFKQRDASSRQVASRLISPVNFRCRGHNRDDSHLQTNCLDQETAENSGTIYCRELRKGENLASQNQSQSLPQGWPTVSQSLSTLENPRSHVGYLPIVLVQALLTMAISCEQTDNQISAIEKVKRRLLYRGDWVGLSPTRPLKMKFSSVEEKDRVGKRRRLSREDEIRQGAMPARRIWSTPFRHEQLSASRINSLQNINIQINEPGPTPIEETTNQGRRHGGASSDSMLFDLENVESSDLPTEMLPLDDDGSPEFSNIRASHDPEIHPGSVYTNFGQVFLRSRSEYGSEQSGSGKPQLLQGPRQKIVDRSPSLKPSNLPVRHRFTLDDQILAEQRESLQRSSEFDWHQKFARQETSIRHPLISLGQQAAMPRVSDNLTPGSRRRKPDTDKTDSVTTNPTESEGLPRTERISRQLPPSPRTGKDAYILSTTQRLPMNLQGKELVNRHEQAGNDCVFVQDSNAEELAPIIFGQRMTMASNFETSKELLSSSHHSPAMKQGRHRRLDSVSSIDKDRPPSLDSTTRTWSIARPHIKIPSKQSTRRGQRFRSINIHTDPHSPTYRRAIQDRNASKSFNILKDDVQSDIAAPASYLPSSTTGFRFPTYWTPRKNEQLPAAGSPVVTASRETTMQQFSPDDGAPSLFQRSQPPPSFSLYRRTRGLNTDDELIDGDVLENGHAHSGLALGHGTLSFFSTPFRR